MQTTVWQPEAECYRAFLPLDLPPEATFVYRNNNNMATSVPNPNVYALGGMDWTLESHDMVVAGREGPWEASAWAAPGMAKQAGMCLPEH